MTLDEAIEQFKYDAECNRADLDLSFAEDNDKVAEWLEELKQYRAIGTPKECRAAVEKQKAKKKDEVKYMARLIDADALLEQYNLNDATKYGNKDAEQQAHSYSTMMLYEIADMIEDAPTVYDVDRVVEQLEDYGNEEMDYYRNTPYEKCIEECVHKAIEIVKGGGANYETQLDGLKEETEEDREL